MYIGLVSDAEDGSRLQFSDLQEAMWDYRSLLYGTVHFYLSPPLPPGISFNATARPLAIGTGTEDFASGALGILEWG